MSQGERQEEPQDEIAAGGRAIVGVGTLESVWQAWPALAALPECTLDDVLPEGSRLVVVAPHPDDEVLASGGLLAMAAQRGVPLRVVSVSDGDASHPGSLLWPPARLAKQRQAESIEGLRQLGLDAAHQLRLQLPDGRIAEHVAELTDRLTGCLAASDTVLTTWSFDGHPDHEATAKATEAACAAVGCRLLQAPVWMWHWAETGDPRVPWSRLRRLALSEDAQCRKAAAISAHRTQLAPQDSGDGPVLPAHALVRLLRPFETLFMPLEDAR